MEDVAKVPYLTKDRGGKKLRRRVPNELRTIANKTTWVKRIEGLSHDATKQLAHSFAVRTDAEIARLRRLKSAEEKVQPTDISVATGVKIHLTDLIIKQVVLTYFHDQEQSLIAAGGYLESAESVYYADHLTDAREDYSQAMRTAAGIVYDGEPHAGQISEQSALSALIAAGLVERSRIGERINRRTGRVTGLEVPPELSGDPKFQLLCRYIEKAELELATRRLRALETGQVPPLVDDFFRPALSGDYRPASAEARSRHRLGQLIEAFEDAKKIEVSASRFSQYQTTIRALREEIGESRLLSSITRQECEALALLFPRIPSHAKQHYKKLALSKAADAFREKHGKFAERYAEGQKQLSILKAIFNLAVQMDWLDKSPADKVEIIVPRSKQKKFQLRHSGYQPFTIKELTKIFSAPLYTGCVDDGYGFNKPGQNVIKSHRYWVPIVALWTGMRMNEILQLERADIRTSDDGIEFIAVTDESELSYDPDVFEKRLKTVNAVRDIPIHAELKRIGFVRWAHAREPGRLFPEATKGSGEKPSDVFTKRFATFLKSRGIWQQHKKVFHSFRGNFNDALRDGGVPEEMRIAINGWDAQQAMDRKYGRGAKVKMLSLQIAKARYDGLDLAHLFDGKDQT